MINRSINTLDGKQNRYHMIPVGGGSAIDYDVSYLGTVINAGTDINDNTLLGNTVAGLFGLNADNSISDPANPLFASPNNAFKVILDKFTAVQILFDGLLNKFYPIGTIYQTDTISSAGDMATQFGGTWVAWGAGKVPVGFDAGQTEFNAVNKTGGSKSMQGHTHTTPNHTHSTENTTAVNNAITDTMLAGGATATGSSIAEQTGVNSATHTHSFSDTTSSGGSHGHTILTITSSSGGSTGLQRMVGNGAYQDYIADAGSHTHTVSGTTGGQSTGHTHTTVAHTHPMAQHSHTMNAHNHTQNAHNHTILSSGAGTSGTTGLGTAENLQPYQVCYFWKRTA